MGLVRCANRNGERFPNKFSKIHYSLENEHGTPKNWFGSDDFPFQLGDFSGLLIFRIVNIYILDRFKTGYSKPKLSTIISSRVKCFLKLLYKIGEVAKKM